MSQDSQDRTISESTRVRICCPGCGRGDHVSWPLGEPTYHWKCFNCSKEFDLSKGGNH
ncbi:MAG: hypothetical protein ABIU54_02055 [Candidatus Eisenbacteria bacterium]